MNDNSLLFIIYSPIKVSVFFCRPHISVSKDKPCINRSPCLTFARYLSFTRGWLVMQYVSLHISHSTNHPFPQHRRPGGTISELIYHSRC